MKPKAKRTIRPSGVEQTDSMFYWKCSVSGMIMFGTPERFAEVVAKFGSEENLVKNYVLRPVKKFVDAGYTPEQIKAIIEKNDGKLPPLAEDTPAVRPVEKKIEEKENPQFIETVEVVEVEHIKEKPPVVYAWQGDPDYFKAAASPINIEQDTKDVCFYPNRNLSDQCHGCTIYDLCSCAAKYSIDDQKKPKRNEVKIKTVAVSS